MTGRGDRGVFWADAIAVTGASAAARRGAERNDNPHIRIASAKAEGFMKPPGHVLVTNYSQTSRFRAHRHEQSSLDPRSSARTGKEYFLLYNAPFHPPEQLTPT